jgi:hypothetical protein
VRQRDEYLRLKEVVKQKNEKNELIRLRELDEYLRLKEVVKQKNEKKNEKNELIRLRELEIGVESITYENNKKRKVEKEKEDKEEIV